MRKLFTLFALVFLTSTAFSQPQTGFLYTEFDNNGVKTRVDIYIPEDYDPNKSYPLLHAWHGAQMPSQNMAQFIRYTTQSIDALIVCPDVNNITSSQQLATAWQNSYQMLGQSGYNIDTNRIIITGFSAGGNYSYTFGLLVPNSYDGIIGLAPAIGMQQFSDDMWKNIKNIRMATILGDKDFNYEPVKQLMEEIQNRGGQLLYIEKPGVEHSDQDYFNSQEYINDYMSCYNFVLGVTDVEIADQPDNSFDIYPNPATDQIQISSEEAIFNHTEVSIFDFNGRMYLSENVFAAEQNNFKLDVSTLPNGSYFVMTKSGEEIRLSKLIINR